MNKDVIMAFSVPHTGTFFLMKWLQILQYPALSFDNVINREKSRGYLQLHSNHMLINETWKDFRWPEYHVAVIPLRHPYKCFLSHHQEGVKLEWVVMCWATMIEEYDKYESIVLPIDIEEELRPIALRRVAEFLECEDYEEALSNYAESWKPINAHDYEAKKIYAETGEMPCDVSDLDFAVDWYEQRMVEFYGEVNEIQGSRRQTFSLTTA